MYLIDKEVLYSCFLLQLQHMVGDESCSQFMTLYLDESKNKGTGGSCATQHVRQAAENAYQKKAEQMCDENLYKITMVSAEVESYNHVYKLL